MMQELLAGKQKQLAAACQQCHAQGIEFDSISAQYAA